jgi:hypothetical protein
MKRLIFFLCLTLLSCETEITDLKIINDSDDIVVYGELTNTKGPIKVRIHQTSKYDPFDISTFKGRSIENAEVYVKDDKGAITILKYLGEGLYSTDDNSIGEINRKYKLHINTLDGLEIKIDAEKIEDMPFDLSANLKDQAGSQNNYFIRRQDFVEFLTTCPVPPPPSASPTPCFSKCWEAPLNTQPLLINDFQLDGEILPLPLNPINLKDITRWAIDLNVLNVSKNVYSFWKKQEQQHLVGGSIFDKIPAQIKENLTCINKPEQQLLGVFLVAGITKKRIQIDRFKDVSPDVF